MELVLSGIQERLDPLKAWLFPPRVLLELEDRSLTLSSLSSKGRELSAENLARIPIPQGIIHAGEPRRQEAISDLIGDLLLENGLQGAHVSASLPLAATHWRVVQWSTPGWPANPAQELEALNPDLSLPYPLQSAYVNLVPLPRRQPSTLPTSLLVTTRRSLVKAWIETLSLAGVSLERLESAQVCELRALAPLLAQAPANELVAVLDLSEASSRLLLLREGVPEFDQALQAAGKPIQADGNQELVRQLERRISYWKEQDSSVSSVQLVLVGALAGRQDLFDLFSQSGAWRVETLDVTERGWLKTPDEADGGPTGLELLRLVGLAQAEVRA